MDIVDGSVAKRKIMILGLPNSGKSQIFNNFTGEYSVVANYPLTTLEIKRSLCRLGGEWCEVIDSPGIYSLYVQSCEEGAVRDRIFSEGVDVILQCIDAARMKQSLALTAELMELGIPMVIALNGIDKASAMGIRIDAEKLQQQLGVPVVESVAVNGVGTAELIEAVFRAQPGFVDYRLPEGVEEGLTAIESLLPEGVVFKRKIALLLLMNDPYISQFVKGVCEGGDTPAWLVRAETVRRRFVGSISLMVSRKSGQWVDDIAAKVIAIRPTSSQERQRRIAHIISHPLTGLPILLLVISLMYFLVVHCANEATEWMDLTLWKPVEHWITGITPEGFLRDLLIGEYGVLSLGIANALIAVLPILTAFYLVFNTLEDVGYLPNLSIMTKRLLEKFGLSGNAIMPLVLGFGCKTMATLTTRSLTSRKEKFIAIYLIAFAIPCAAQAGINMSILGRMGMQAFAITFSVLILAEVLAGLALNRILKSDTRTEFIHELPPIRLPTLKGTLQKTYYRLVWFLKEAVPVFIYASLLLFFFDRVGLLGELRLLLKPLIQQALGLPLSMVDAIILCVVRREAAAGMIINLIKTGQLNYVQCIVAVIVTTMFVPCFANTMTMIKELGGKRAFMMVGAINASAFLVGGVLNWTLIHLLHV